MSGQIWSVDSLGGYMSSQKLSREFYTSLQTKTRFRAFCDIREEEGIAGLHRGQSFTWDVYGNVVDQGATLTETNTMPETNFVITQGTLTMVEAGQAVPYTGLLDNFSEHPIRKIVNTVLINDAKKTLDTLAHTQFAATKLRVTPEAGTSLTTLVLATDGVATVTNNIALQKEHVKLIVDLMKERNIPGWKGTDDYCSIARPSTFRTLKNNLENVYQYRDQGFQMILNGEIGRYEGVRFVEQTNQIAGAGSTAATSWANNQSDTVYFFGDEAVTEGIAVPEEIRGKLASDYGRSKGIAWYYVGGFGLIHVDAEQTRVIMWDSAT